MPSIGRCERICRSTDFREAAAIKRFRVLSDSGYRDGLSVRLGTPKRSPPPPAEGSYFFGASHASVTALSMMCRSTLLHRGQPNVRKSWPNELGSIAVNFIGEPQVVHCGPWFCTSSIGFPSPSAGALPNSRSPITAVAVR
jgi:hypothetical protein